MSRAIGLGALTLALVLLGLWASGAGTGLARYAADLQAQAQAQMAGALRALRMGQPGALATLWGLCFAYGVAHAVGPGHGKVVLGAYGAARAVSAARIAMIALGASLAQGASAVLLVLGGVVVLGLARENVTALAEGALDRAGLWAVLVIGLWLVWRGVRALRVQHHARAHTDTHVHDHDHGHGHGHSHDEPCATCGHSHGPSPAQMMAVTGWRETAGLIAVVALRPCTGALFLLVLTWRMGLVWQGLAGVAAMAIGTGLVTASVAMLAVGARQGALGGLSRLGPVAAFLELGAGALVVLVTLSALGML